MKKTILGVIIVCALGAIGYVGYEYTNYNKNLPKTNSAGVVQTPTTQEVSQSDSKNSTEKPSKTSSSVAKTTVDAKSSKTTSQDQNSASTVAKFVPSNVINYTTKDTDTNSKENSPATSQENSKTSSASVSQQKNNDDNTTKKQVAPSKPAISKPTQDNSSAGTDNASKPTSNSQSKTTTSTNSPSENAPIISASDISIPQNSSFNWGLVKVSTNQPNTRILFSGSVNPSKVGTYPVLIQAINTNGLRSEKTINVIVEKSDTATIPVPVIVGSNIIIGQGGIYTPNMLDVHATVDGNPVPITYSGVVDNNTPGIYTVTATATNSQGVSTSKEFTVQVIHVK